MNGQKVVAVEKILEMHSIALRGEWSSNDVEMKETPCTWLRGLHETGMHAFSQWWVVYHD